MLPMWKGKDCMELFSILVARKCKRKYRLIQSIYKNSSELRFKPAQLKKYKYCQKTGISVNWKSLLIKLKVFFVIK